MDSDDFILRWWRRPKKTSGKSQAPRLTRKRDLLLAFAIVSLPLLAIASVLLAFIFYPSKREIPDPYAETPELPVVQYDTTYSYYTTTTTGSFLLVGSWASNIAEIVVAPFMLLFSYAVAREISHQSMLHSEISTERPPLLREIMRGAQAGLWHWGAHITSKKNRHHRQRPSNIHVINIAALGLFTASLLTVMIIVGDNWLHTTTHSIPMTQYNVTTNSTENGNPAFDNYQAGFAPIDLCNDTLTAPLPQNISSAPLPCSLNTIQGLDNVENPAFVYLTLGTGISPLSSGFNGQNYTALQAEEDRGTATKYQIVTYSDHGVNHSLFFYPDAAQEFAVPGLGTDYGIDYVAKTTSMVTNCTFATQECNITSKDTGTNDISIPFKCYDDFSGDLGQTPSTGHERAQGWNMSFYELVDGSPHKIPVQAQSNPFHFYVATAVNSIDFSDLEDDLQDNPEKPYFVDARRGFTAFALSCEATIYDVDFSLVNGSFAHFNTSKSSPQKASIIKAPLQIGFGQYHLYEAASLAVLTYNNSIAASMGESFSQTAMALASGVFDFDNNTLQRFRWTMLVTKVHKAPFWYLVVVCLLYSVFGMGMTVAAFYLRRMPEVRDQQAKLMVEWAPELLSMSQSEVEKVEERSQD